jgi:hypothetical protein
MKTTADAIAILKERAKKRKSLIRAIPQPGEIGRLVLGRETILVVVSLPEGKPLLGKSKLVKSLRLKLNFIRPFEPFDPANEQHRRMSLTSQIQHLIKKWDIPGFPRT